jgi:hypothetical protein
MGEVSITGDIGIHIDVTFTGHRNNLSGFCVWKWVASDQIWVKIKDYSEAGYDPGTGPTNPGRYDGQIVRWASILWTD